MSNFNDELLKDFACKVYKSPEKHDDRTLLCGSHVKRDRKGEYFIIPASYADYISKIFPQYEVGKPYRLEPEVPEK